MLVEGPSADDVVAAALREAGRGEAVGVPACPSIGFGFFFRLGRVVSVGE